MKIIRKLVLSFIIIRTCIPVKKKEIIKKKNGIVSIILIYIMQKYIMQNH